MSSAFEVFRILIVYGEVVQQLPMLENRYSFQNCQIVSVKLML